MRDGTAGCRRSRSATASGWSASRSTGSWPCPACAVAHVGGQPGRWRPPRPRQPARVEASTARASAARRRAAIRRCAPAGGPVPEAGRPAPGRDPPSTAGRLALVASDPRVPAPPAWAGRPPSMPSRNPPTSGTACGPVRSPALARMRRRHGGEDDLRQPGRVHAVTPVRAPGCAGADRPRMARATVGRPRRPGAHRQRRLRRAPRDAAARPATGRRHELPGDLDPADAAHPT